MPKSKGSAKTFISKHERVDSWVQSLIGHRGHTEARTHAKPDVLLPILVLTITSFPAVQSISTMHQEKWMIFSCDTCTCVTAFTPKGLYSTCVKQEGTQQHVMWNKYSQCCSQLRGFWHFAGENLSYRTLLVSLNCGSLWQQLLVCFHETSEIQLHTWTN